MIVKVSLWKVNKQTIWPLPPVEAMQTLLDYSALD